MRPGHRYVDIDESYRRYKADSFRDRRYASSRLPWRDHNRASGQRWYWLYPLDTRSAEDFICKGAAESRVLMTHSGLQVSAPTGMCRLVMPCLQLSHVRLRLESDVHFKRPQPRRRTRYGSLTLFQSLQTWPMLVSGLIRSTVDHIREILGSFAEECWTGTWKWKTFRCALTGPLQDFDSRTDAAPNPIPPSSLGVSGFRCYISNSQGTGKCDIRACP